MFQKTSLASLPTATNSFSPVPLHSLSSQPTFFFPTPLLSSHTTLAIPFLYLLLTFLQVSCLSFYRSLHSCFLWPWCLKLHFPLNLLPPFLWQDLLSSYFTPFSPYPTFLLSPFNHFSSFSSNLTLLASLYIILLFLCSFSYFTSIS